MIYIECDISDIMMTNVRVDDAGAITEDQLAKSLEAHRAAAIRGDADHQSSCRGTDGLGCDPSADIQRGSCEQCGAEYDLCETTYIRRDHCSCGDANNTWRVMWDEWHADTLRAIPADTAY